jgi:hypothetical protein
VYLDLPPALHHAAGYKWWTARSEHIFGLFEGMPIASAANLIEFVRVVLDGETVGAGITRRPNASKS